MSTSVLIYLSAVLFCPPWAYGQGYINQSQVSHILDTQVGDIDSVPEIEYGDFIFYSTRGNTAQARNTFYKIVGDGDVDLGHRRAKLVELINRRLVTDVAIGDTIVLPSTFDADFRAYSPFPLLYDAGRQFDKLFVIHKEVQAFAAYEHGKLVRWGIVNTGAAESPTPSGRFNFNWKAPYKVSSLSPPDELWEMYWVFNFHQERGIHIHQYAMPTGGPTSHGCVRLVEDDARFVYNWADSWTTTAGTGIGSERGRITRQGTTVLVVGDDPLGKPEPFSATAGKRQLRTVILPEDPMAISPGTNQQVHFDG